MAGVQRVSALQQKYSLPLEHYGSEEQTHAGKNTFGGFKVY
jgi:hypothetical protein